MSDPIRHDYGRPNFDYISTWFDREDDGPFWALNLMKYRERAVAADGTVQDRSGLEADNEYNPSAQIEAVGGRMVLVAPVEHQLRGDDVVWDRIAIVLYPTRMSFIEMSNRDDFKEKHEHKNAGMERTIVVASMPRGGDPAPADVSSAAGTGDRLLLQVVTDAEAPDLADDIDATRIGRFTVEGNIFGDERQWAEARWDRISAETAASLAAQEAVHDPNAYALVLIPHIDTLAESAVTPLP
ncbi:MAG TPA: hypothetical protein DCS55_13400 [Acidimicrobiaceae bacterium]|nr:hypothetical protein [Acidimicrobiaceae bacterium]